MKLTEYEDTNDGIMWLSKPHDIGDLRGVVFFLQLVYTENLSREWAKQGKYHVGVGCVVASAVPLLVLAGLVNTIGLTDEQWTAGGDAGRAAELVRAGFTATFWDQTGNRKNRLLSEGRRVLATAVERFDALMSRPQNRVGATGYDWVKGDFLGPSKGKSIKQMVEDEVARQS